MDKSSSNNNSMLDARKSSNSANKNADSNERKSWNLNNFYSQEDRVNKANYAVFSDNNLDVQDDQEQMAKKGRASEADPGKINDQIHQDDNDSDLDSQIEFVKTMGEKNQSASKSKQSKNQGSPQSDDGSDESSDESSVFFEEQRDHDFQQSIRPTEMNYQELVERSSDLAEVFESDSSVINVDDL